MHYHSLQDELRTRPSIKDGGYENDEATKEQMFVWVEQMWQQKDGRIATMLAEFE